MNEIERFAQEVAANIKGLAEDRDVQALSRIWAREVTRHKYTYNFSWLGRPIIQTPQDMMAMQEIVWRTRPDVIIETGVAHGGSLIFYASLLELLGGDGVVLGIDIDIRAHNRAEIEKHPMAKRIRLFQGSSVEAPAVAEARKHIASRKRVMVVLDSNHTHAHVLKELELYAPFVTKIVTWWCSIRCSTTCRTISSKTGRGAGATIPRRRSANFCGTAIVSRSTRTSNTSC
jgi:cephalosporin hydroxylase